MRNEYLRWIITVCQRINIWNPRRHNNPPSCLRIKSSCLITTLVLIAFWFGATLAQHPISGGSLSSKLPHEPLDTFEIPTPEDEIDDAILESAIAQSMAEWEERRRLKLNKTQASLANGRSLRVKRDEEVVCYGELLGCFRDEGPFDYLDMLPSPPTEIGTEFLLFTKNNRVSPQPFSYFNFTSAFFGSNFNASHQTKIIIHGFGSNCQRLWATEMRFALLSVVECNIICVDWENGAATPNYVRAAVNTRLVGKQVALFVFWLLENFRTRTQDIHLIGFSLGAHVAGFAGSEVKNLSRITGLDPAGPLFEAYDPKTRLDTSDALFVDVIHSNGDSLLMGGLGSWEPMGHMDFYPNGGRVQKGCSNLFVGAVRDFLWSSDGDGRSLCNHRRAYKFFTESVSPRCPFPAFTCESYDKFLTGTCFDPTSPGHGSGNMGYYADRSWTLPPPGSKGPGPLYLITREDEPFCANQYRITVESSPSPSPISTYGGLEAVLIGHDFINETFSVTTTAKENMVAGAVLQRIIVAHPAITEPIQVQLKYNAYQGWLYSGISRWSLDRLVITNAFGQSLSFCSRGLLLPTGVPVTVTLSQGICVNRVIPPTSPSASASASSASPNSIRPSTSSTPPFSSSPNLPGTPPPPSMEHDLAPNHALNQMHQENPGPWNGSTNSHTPNMVAGQGGIPPPAEEGLQGSTMDWGEWSPLSPAFIKEQEGQMSGGFGSNGRIHPIPLNTNAEYPPNNNANLNMSLNTEPQTSPPNMNIPDTTPMPSSGNCTDGNCEERSTTLPVDAPIHPNKLDHQGALMDHENENTIKVMSTNGISGSGVGPPLMEDGIFVGDDYDLTGEKHHNATDEEIPQLQVPPESFWKAMENTSDTPIQPYEGADPDVVLPPRLSYILQQLDNQGLGPKSQPGGQGPPLDGRDHDPIQGHGHQNLPVISTNNIRSQNGHISHRFEKSNSLAPPPTGPTGIGGPGHGSGSTILSPGSIRRLIPSSRALKHRPVILSTVRRRSKNLDVAPPFGINALHMSPLHETQHLMAHQGMHQNMRPLYAFQTSNQGQAQSQSGIEPSVLRRIPMTIQFGSRIGKSAQFSPSFGTGPNASAPKDQGFIILPYPVHHPHHSNNQQQSHQQMNHHQHPESNNNMRRGGGGGGGGNGPTILVAGRRGLLAPNNNHNGRYNNSEIYTFGGTEGFRTHA